MANWLSKSFQSVVKNFGYDKYLNLEREVKKIIKPSIDNYKCAWGSIIGNIIEQTDLTDLLQTKENLENKSINLEIINDINYPTNNAVYNFVNSNKTVLNKEGVIYKDFKICTKSVITTSISNTISYSEFGFSNILIPPIITVIKNISTASEACFPILKSYNNESCIVSVAESKTTNTLLISSAEGLELVSGIIIQITIIGI